MKTEIQLFQVPIYKLDHILGHKQDLTFQEIETVQTTVSEHTLETLKPLLQHF